MVRRRDPVDPDPKRIEHAKPRSRAERRFINFVMRAGELSLRDLTERSDFTQQYVSKLAGNLLAEGIILQKGRVKSGRGQPSIAIEVNGEHAYALGASVMTDALSVALVDLAGRVVGERHVALMGVSRTEVAAQLAEVGEELIGHSGVERERVVGAGIAISGYFVGEGRQVNPPAALSALALTDLEPVFAEALALPVIIDNDGNTAAAGEGLIGVGRWAPTFAYLFMSAGLGGGVVVDGKPFRGAHGNAGEFANIIPRSQYYPTLETLRLAIVDEGRRFDTIEHMLAEFDLSLPGVEAWIDTAKAPLSQFISAISACFDPHAVVLGGRMPRSLAMALIPHLEIYNADRRATPKPVARIVAAEAKGDAAACGAALMPLSQLFYIG